MSSSSSTAGTQPGAPQPSVLHLAWPLVLSFVMRQLFTFVDGLFAKQIGDHAVAGIGLAFPLEFLLVAFWVGSSTGLTSLLSRAMGAHEGERIEQVLRVGRHVVLALIVPFLVLGAGIWFFAHQLLDTSLPPAVVEQFRIYASVIVAGTAITGFWSILPDSLVKAHHDTRATMWAGIWSNLVNVGLNCVFTLVLHWGMFGIAFSTVIGRLGGLVYALVAARRHEARRGAAGLDTVPGSYPHPLRSMLALAVPAALTYVLMATESTIANAQLARSAHPTEAIAAYGIYYRYLMLFAMPVIATGVALLPFVARMWGRRDVAGIRRAFREVVTCAVAYVAVIVAPVTILGRHALAAGFAESPLTRELASFGLSVLPLAVLAAIPFFACRPVFDGLQLGRPGLAVAALRYVALTAPLAWLGATLAARSGRPLVHGVIVALVCAAAMASLVLLAWMRRVLAQAELYASGANVGPWSEPSHRRGAPTAG